MTQQDILQHLRESGVRLTPQRLLILNAVSQGGGHMGVDEVFRKARETYPYMDIATVYRTLHLFKRIGVVTEVAIGDRLHFEITDPDAKHHHMVCRSCAVAYDLAPDYLDEFRSALTSEFNFTPDLDNFTVSGTCSNCNDPEGRVPDA